MEFVFGDLRLSLMEQCELSLFRRQYFCLVVIVAVGFDNTEQPFFNFLR